MTDMQIQPQVAAQQMAAIQPTGSVWTDKGAFETALRAANMLSQTALVPETYRNKPQDCFLALEMANRIGVSPLVVMQNMFVVKGKPSWSGQACCMMIEASGKFRQLRHNYFGEEGKESRGCYLSAIRTDDGQLVNGPKVTMALAKSEGWTSNSKWRNMPELMLAYRAAAFFARVYCPDALMGVHTSEEMEDVAAAQTSTQDLTSAIMGGNKQ